MNRRSASGRPARSVAMQPWVAPEELARVAERMPQRLVRLAHVFQMSGQAVDELERGEFPLDRQHGASGWFSNRPWVKCVGVFVQTARRGTRTKNS